MAGQSKVGLIRAEDPDGNYAIVKVDADGNLKTSGDITLSESITASPLVKQTATVTLPGAGGTYAAQDEVSNSATAGSVTPLTFTNMASVNGGTGYLVKAVIEASSPTVANGVFRLWLFNAAPTAYGNDLPYQLDAVDKAKRIGYVDFSLITEGTGSDGAYALDDGLRLAFQCAVASRNLYGLLVAKAAYVWVAAETFDVSLISEVA